MWKDEFTFMVCRFTAPFISLGFNSFFVTSFFTLNFLIVLEFGDYLDYLILYPGIQDHLQF